MYKIILKGEPKSTNSIYRSVCRGKFPSVYMSSEGKTLKEDYAWQAKAQFKSKLLKGNLEAIIRLYFKINRIHDIDNYGKIFLDSLTGIVWNDDSQIQRMTVEKFLDPKNPRIEIEVYELD